MSSEEITMSMSEQKIATLENALKFLKSRKVKFEIKNGGTHLIIDAGPEDLDYWPTTGKWRVRGVDGDTRVGIKSMMEYYAKSMGKNLEVVIGVKDGIVEVLQCPKGTTVWLEYGWAGDRGPGSRVQAFIGGKEIEVRDLSREKE